MTSIKTKKRANTTKADLEMISGKENLLIQKEKRFQTELKKTRRPQVEQQTLLKEPKKKSKSQKS